MAVLKWLLLCLLLSAGPKLAAARGLLEAVPGNFFSARALLQAEQCTCTCPSPTTGSAPALAPQLTGAAAPGLAPETGSPPAPAPAPLPENTSALAPAPEMGSPPAEAPGPDMGNSTVPSTVPAPAPESESPGASAPALVPGSSISETPVPIISVSPPAAPNAGPYCTANIQPGVTWSNGDGTYSGIMNVMLVNHGSNDIPTGWTFSIQNPNYLGVYGAWNWMYSGMDSTGNATGYANQSWETIQANAQNQVNVGAIFQGSSPQNFYPRGITVNGQRCFIQQLR
ncbi:hypothetical protein CVIRNUC_006901 [Coccomyxa viridis]|uniref:CBM2 domain-containing protein n=1 Tax=Coccomyxa viridis TaxID=1274662 RepID=A0AAV1IBV2_9CHLO|nr:hypothetical protein CVIRNUC_006901 [Coccomyxa viridis]